MNVRVHQPWGDQQAGRVENLRGVIALQGLSDCRDPPGFHRHVGEAVKL